MVLLGRPNGLDRDRLGLIASRRIGGAVIRNRAKRRLRDVFRRTRGAAGASRVEPALDVVAIARREIVGAPMIVVEREFCSALRKLRTARF